MFDTASRAKAKNVKNLWITCGSIHEEPLVELCRVIDAANVNLKSFDPEIYRKLNSGSLEPILNTLKTLKREGVWFEVTNLVVPTYTDDLEMMRRMCDWPVDILLQARDLARTCGLHYVYIGNVRGVEDAETTHCPGCRKAVIERTGFYVLATRLQGGRCASCGTPIAGVWSA
jgi:pyruvate formate lyase activating enzyme